MAMGVRGATIRGATIYLWRNNFVLFVAQQLCGTTKSAMLWYVQ
jgi:hypothetical protein